ncbi:hypothetical protein CRU87_02120 [Aliarcobacter trophiarum LMG 25534]|uniref:Uncharacterized protein n=1 Tax=Aliarcobacter trophiarum LMG 25534 TaxID=1032241 RepID=A0AAD0QJ47_9BACT|nr:hypothetical protein [Aliarcobacter trophiarum]AXK48862.1 hypothetical protein ATR_0998 [Aliarcobacter trophiarum LMG 25534]RXI24960.1 hypothetical protein CRU89_09110 [Aliarcobacter trophiarum]RXJ92598.1 hypothetical protein CRU87_02120 [Aliarcobacter trophiarum LMG 25534]
MRIDNNLGAMIGSALQIQESASNIAKVANTLGDGEFQEYAGDIASELVAQIPEIVAYNAQAKSIEVQSIAMERLLDLKA